MKGTPRKKPSVKLIRYDDDGEWRSAVPITVEEAREAWSEVTAATATLWSLVITAVPQAYWELAEIAVGATAITCADQFSVHTFPHRLSDGRFTNEKISYYAKLTANWSEVEKKLGPKPYPGPAIL
jgi:hypothetical protein